MVLYSDKSSRANFFPATLKMGRIIDWESFGDGAFGDAVFVNLFEVHRY